MNKVILALLCLAAGAGTALAQSCGSTYSYRGATYSAPTYQSYQTYSAPYVTPYAAPKKVEYKQADYFVRLVAFFPVLDVPTYGAAVYAPPVVQTPQTAAPASVQTQPNGDLAKVMTALLTINKAVELIDQRLGRLEGPQAQALPKGASPAPKGYEQGPTPKQETAQQIAVNSCAQCHAPTTATDFGGGFIMFTDDGRLEKLSSKSAMKIVGKVHQNTMPPREKPKGFTGVLPPPLSDYQASVMIAYYTGQTSEDRRDEIALEKPAPKVFVRTRK